MSQHPTREDSPRPFDRRRFIRWLAFAGVGALSVQKLDTFKLAWEEGKDIAAALAARSASSLMPGSEALRRAYAMFLAAHGFENVPTSVILAPHFNRHGKIQNCLPPESLWKNILPTLRVVDRLAQELGEKVRINSAYRSPEYNATCPGAAKWSQHLRNNALDIQFRSAPAEVVRAARSLRDQRLFGAALACTPGSPMSTPEGTIGIGSPFPPKRRSGRSLKPVYSASAKNRYEKTIHLHHRNYRCGQRHPLGRRSAGGRSLRRRSG